MWQLLFHSSPQVLQPLNHGLKVRPGCMCLRARRAFSAPALEPTKIIHVLLQVDERVIRYMVQKHSITVPKPSTSVVSKWASSILDEEYKDKLSAAQQRGQPLWWEQLQPPPVPLQAPKPLSELFPEDDQADEQDSTSEAPAATDPAAVEASAPSTEPQPSVPTSDMSPDASLEEVLQAQAAPADTAEAATPPKVK